MSGVPFEDTIRAIPMGLRPGGVVSWPVLHRHGATRGSLEAALAGAQAVRLRVGWYALPGADDRVAQAVSSGGVLSCVSALSLQGVWRPAQDHGLHVRCRRGRASARGVVGCSPHVRGPAPLLAVDPLGTALRAMVWCLPDEEAIACLDSAVRLGLISLGSLRTLFPVGWTRVHGLVDRCDWADSGSESLVRVRLRGRHLSVRSQVTINGVGRVDLLIGDRLVVEVDSHEHHTSRQNYHSDRRRDQQLLAMGYLVIRVTWEQVMFDWESVEQTILLLVRRREHRWPRSRVTRTEVVTKHDRPLASR